MPAAVVHMAAAEPCWARATPDVISRIVTPRQSILRPGMMCTPSFPGRSELFLSIIRDHRPRRQGARARIARVASESARRAPGPARSVARDRRAGRAGARCPGWRGPRRHPGGPAAPGFAASRSKSGGSIWPGRGRSRNRKPAPRGPVMRPKRFEPQNWAHWFQRSRVRVGGSRDLSGRGDLVQIVGIAVRLPEEAAPGHRVGVHSQQHRLARPRIGQREERTMSGADQPGAVGAGALAPPVPQPDDRTPRDQGASLQPEVGREGTPARHVPGSSSIAVSSAATAHRVMAINPRPSSARTAVRLAIRIVSISRQTGRSTGYWNGEPPGRSGIGRVVGARKTMRSPDRLPEPGGTVSWHRKRTRCASLTSMQALQPGVGVVVQDDVGEHQRTAVEFQQPRPRGSADRATRTAARRRESSPPGSPASTPRAGGRA